MKLKKPILEQDLYLYLENVQFKMHISYPVVHYGSFMDMSEDLGLIFCTIFAIWNGR